MTKNYFMCFLGGGFVFYFATLLCVSCGFDAARLNLLLAMVLTLLFNANGVFGKRFVALGVLGAFLYALTFLISAKVWGVWLFVVFIFSAGMSGTDFGPQAIGYLFIFVATFFNLSFVTNTSIIDVQHDFASCFNYVEYILENDFLFWRENPLLSRPSYSTYHPILHFFLAAGYFKLGMLFGIEKGMAAEAAQAMFCFYLFWYYLLCAKILERLDVSRTSYLIGLCFIIFFPAYNSIGGFFNNDCLLLPLQAGVFYSALCYYQDGDKKSLWLIFLYHLAASLTKLSGILVLPAAGLMVFMRLYQKRDKKTLKEVLLLGMGVVFGVMIWPCYQYFKFNIPFDYVPDLAGFPLTHYSLWQRFNPLKAFVYDDMFYDTMQVNLWETLTKTALFGEYDFSFKVQELFFLLPFMVFSYKLILGLSGVVFILFFKLKDKKIFSFFAMLIFSLFFGEVMFVLKHPFMCNQDFRYVALLPMGLAGILALGAERFTLLQKIFPLIIAFCLCSALVWWRISF